MIGGKSSRLGAVSLWTSLAGVIVVVVLALLTALLGSANVRPYYLAGFILFVAAECVALITGSIDRQSPSGRAGLSISSVSLAIAAVALLFVAPVRRVLGGKSW